MGLADVLVGSAFCLLQPQGPFCFIQCVFVGVCGVGGGMILKEDFVSHLMEIMSTSQLAEQLLRDQNSLLSADTKLKNLS